MPDELLSSWLIRLAHAHGLKVQTFTRQLVGLSHRVWNRDIDRQAPEWLIQSLCRNTGTTLERARQTTLKAYEGVLYREYRETSVLKWILPLGIYHTVLQGFGIQYCPQCLAEDETPYFRKRWRVAFYTHCSVHQIMLHDRCPQCGVSVAFHRREMGKIGQIEGGLLCACHRCNFDLRKAKAKRPKFYEDSLRESFELLIRCIENPGLQCKRLDVQYYNVMHHLCWAMLSEYLQLRLLEFVRSQVKAPKMILTKLKRPFEYRSIQERHQILQLACWLIAEPESRLTAAWSAKATSYSALLRDFKDRPDWYDRIVEKLESRSMKGKMVKGKY